MATYTVHLYREMHLVFRDIEAETPDQAARLAADRKSQEAEACEDCAGISHSAHVEPEGGDPSEAPELVRLRADGGAIEAAPAQVTNRDRAKWADAAVRVFMQHTGCDDEDALGDLLADLMHWAVQNEFDLPATLERALGHFEAELVEEGRMPPVPPARDGRGRFEHAATPLLGTLFTFLSAQGADRTSPSTVEGIQ